MDSMGIPISILIGKIVIATISLPLLTRTRTASLEVTSSDVEATSLPITFPSMLYFEFREPDDERTLSKVESGIPLARNKERQSKLPCRFQYELKAIHSCNEGKVFSNPICSTLNGIDLRTGFEPIEKRLFACNVTLGEKRNSRSLLT